MDRKSVILSKITKAELGLEIGPSFNPVVQKKLVMRLKQSITWIRNS